MTILSIPPAEVHARIAAGEPVDLIDVRTAEEWNAGHAAGARHVPLNRLDPAVVASQRLGKPDDPIYVICASGARSATACETFHRAGITQAVNVAGGTNAWRAAGLPMERNLKQASLGALRQVGIMAVALAAVLFLMPCSPVSLWGGAFCPTVSAAEAQAPGVKAAAAPAGAVDFARDVVTASATVPVLVDFHATWCGPCKRMEPEIAALATERGDRLRVVKIDVDAQSNLAQEHGVSSIPDVRLWIGGKEVARFGGYRAKAEIATWLDAAAASVK